MLKRTPLFASHERLGGKLIEFGGWEMPVQYTGIVEEHLAVREAGGIFDICHMGEFLATGDGAAEFLNRTLTNDIGRLRPGQGQYTLMCYESGGVVDDLYVYRLSGAAYLLIVNASRIEADWAWLQERLGAGAAGVELRNLSDATGAVAVQGPKVRGFIDELAPGAACGGTAVSRPFDLKKNEVASFHMGPHTLHIARTGYTGEDGFEVVAPAEAIVEIWDRLLVLGASRGLKPCGLGARDTLRTEVCYPLYGHELSDGISPVEAGLGYFVAFEKGPFVGRAALAEQKARGPARKIAAFRMTGKTPPPRPGYAILSGGRKVGEVTSGTQSPSLNAGIGLGLVPAALSAPGTALEIEIRGKTYPAAVVPKPIYRKS
ncbi:MAG: glycine cleavage system aminomethyltransferase GcvT [Verrucomicrobiota bacterium]